MSSPNPPEPDLFDDEYRDERPDPEVIPEGPAEPEVWATDPSPRAPRMRTVVLGLVLLVIAGAVLVSQLSSISVDPGTILLALMIGGGLLLIAGARKSLP